MVVESTHTVVAGETVSSIAAAHNDTVDGIRSRNHISDLNKIMIGDSLIILSESESNSAVSGFANDLNLTEDEKNLLTQLVYSEANNQSEKGKEAVVDVVINRLFNENYPNSVKEIILQKGQFQNSAKLHTLPIEESNRAAVERALNEVDTTNGALFFWNPKLVKSDYMASLEVVAIIGDHEFLK